MAFPKTLDEMKTYGYKYENDAICRGCGDEIEWWHTPKGKPIPMNPMNKGTDDATAHWVTCTEADTFRK